MWEVYESEGSDKAYTFGQGIGLKESTLRAWIRMWDKEKGKEPTPVPGQPKTRRPRGTVGRARVCDAYNPKRLGWLVDKGEQCSVIMWDRHMVEECEANEHWKLLENAETPA
jgi:hypothetical protein